MKPTETPRTDSHAFHRITGLASPDGDVVGVEVARQLERELEKANATARAMSKLHDDAETELAAEKVERDQWRGMARELAGILKITITADEILMLGQNNVAAKQCLAKFNAMEAK